VGSAVRACVGVLWADELDHGGGAGKNCGPRPVSGRRTWGLFELLSGRDGFTRPLNETKLHSEVSLFSSNLEDGSEMSHSHIQALVVRTKASVVYKNKHKVRSQAIPSGNAGSKLTLTKEKA
jgi:hypothetical protein